MAYTLKEATIRTDNSTEGMKAISELWLDITSGKLPVLFDSMHNFLPGISPVSRYSNYASDETGAYDLTVMGVTADFFQQMEAEIGKGLYRKYETQDADGDISACTKSAWEQVWGDQAEGKINRSFTADYESTVPAEYTKDGKAHCYLYIAVR